MSKLQRYVLTEVLKAFVPALMIFMLIVTLGFCVQLLRDGLDVVRLAGLPRHLLSFSLPLVLPSAFLTAVVMGFARLSADNEVTAMRSGGINLFHIMWPICAMAVLLSGAATYLHFQAVPRARQRIELLKYEAIKQILIDKIALSSQRHFKFHPWYIQYDDFREGQMQSILIFSIQAGVPRTIITASRGMVSPDPTRPEFILLSLQDCAMTELHTDEARGPLTLGVDQMEIRLEIPELRAARDQEHMVSKLKHLGLAELLKRWAELRKAVSEHTDRYANPDEVGEEAALTIQKRSVEAAELDQKLDRHTKNLRKLRREDMPKLQSILELKEEEITAAREHKQLLNQQQVSLAEELKELEAKGGGESENYDLIVEKRKNLEDVKSRMEVVNSRINDAESEIKETHAHLKTSEAEARTVEQGVRRLEAEQRGIQKDILQRKEVRQRAAVQGNLRSLNIRIHKRLTQAFAILAFAIVGMPLGIMTRRRSVMVAFGISFAIMLLLFYPFLVVGQMAAETGLLPTAPAMWSGNAVTFTIGLLLTINVLRK